MFRFIRVCPRCTRNRGCVVILFVQAKQLLLGASAPHTRTTLGTWKRQCHEQLKEHVPRHQPQAAHPAFSVHRRAHNHSNSNWRWVSASHARSIRARVYAHVHSEIGVWVLAARWDFSACIDLHVAGRIICFTVLRDTLCRFEGRTVTDVENPLDLCVEWYLRAHGRMQMVAWICLVLCH